MSNVVKFPYRVSRKAHARKPRTSENGTPEDRLTLQEMVAEDIDAERTLARPLSTTGQNGRLRNERREVWRMAEAATRYWRVRLDFEDVVSWAQRLEILEGSFHPAVDPDYRRPMVEKHRAALVKQLLTPAWDTASVKWKQMALARGQHHYTGVKSERIERAIADDLAFLATHPVRRSNSEAIARRREFKDTVRQRIKDVAEALDISVEDIRPALTLKHQEIGKFGEEHGVSLDWLLAGEGRFKKDVVGATPPADQEAIRAKVCEILQERGL